MSVEQTARLTVLRHRGLSEPIEEPEDLVAAPQRAASEFADYEGMEYNECFVEQAGQSRR